MACGPSLVTWALPAGVFWKIPRGIGHVIGLSASNKPRLMKESQ